MSKISEPQKTKKLTKQQATRKQQQKLKSKKWATRNSKQQDSRQGFKTWAKHKNKQIGPNAERHAMKWNGPE